jgi:hypothetical protein
MLPHQKKILSLLLLTLLCASLTNAENTDSEGTTNETPQESSDVFIATVLQIGVDVPKLDKYHHALADFIISPAGGYDKIAGKMTQKGHSQLTILGNEMAARYKEFYKELKVENLTVKTDKTARAQTTAEDFLNGLGNCWSPMKSVNDPSNEQSLPPYKYIKDGWNRKHDKWMEKLKANESAEPEERFNIESRFILKKTNMNYDLLMNRNSLRIVDGIDEDLYLFDAQQNCKNLSALNTAAPHLQQMAAYSELARIFDAEMKKMNKGQPLADGKMDSKKNPTYYGFYGDTYDFKNILAVARLCVYESHMLPEKDRKCSAILMKASIAVFKYESFGIDSNYVDRLQTNTLFAGLYHTLQRAKMNDDKKLDKANQDLITEKFRVYVTKDWHFPASILLLFGGYSRMSEQPKYAKLMTKAANIENLEYLTPAPPRASSIVFRLTRQTVVVDSVPSSSMIVDVRYNGLSLNYCDNTNRRGCTWAEFEAKIRRLIYSSKEFTDKCNGDVALENQVFFVIAVSLMVLCLIWRCIKAILVEKAEDNIRKHTANRGVDALLYDFLKVKIYREDEVEVEGGKGLELGVGVEVEVKEGDGGGLIAMDETVSDIDVGGTFEIGVEGDVEVEVDAEVEVEIEAPVVAVEADVEVEVEGKLFFLRKNS